MVAEHPGEVIFFDFGDTNFDESVTLIVVRTWNGNDVEFVEIRRLIENDDDPN